VAAIEFAAALVAQGDHARAQSVLDEARQNAERAGDRTLLVTAAIHAGVLRLTTGRLVESERFLRDAIEQAAAIGAVREEARASHVLGVMLQEAGRARDAEAHYHRAHDMFHRLDDRLSVGRTRAALGSLLHEQGELDCAREQYEAACAELHRVGSPGLLSAAQAALGAALADLDRIEEAEAVFTGLAAGTEHARLHTLARAHLDLAHARQAQRSGAVDAARTFRDRAAHVLARSGNPPAGASVRCGVRLLARVLEPMRPNSRSFIARLVVAKGARSLVLPSGERVDLSRHASLRLIVLALARRHRDGISAGLPSDELLACGWPGERVDPLSGSARVRVALSRLRSLGLRDLLVRIDHGYVLAPEIAVDLEDDPPIAQ
jgi:tetratricopeptide (TPR) repeat protein